ncbi:hypothetical protein HYT53_01060 [Candidatus Woesearchaeota archaeon]|nr:hypothetical protein [Candidatus Woesearchaeota archaeon]
MGEKLQNIGKYVQEYSQYARDGLIELFEHPVKHTSKALKDLVQDYWDAGLGVLTGLALTDSVRELIGDQAVISLYIGGTLVSLGAPQLMFMVKQENEVTRTVRIGRNAMLEFDVIYTTSPYSTNHPMYVVSLFAFATLFEYIRRVGKTPSIRDSPTYDALENKLQKSI